jgi:threonine dehydratase
VASEPGGAAALAALLSGRYQPAADERVGVLVCGGNTTWSPSPQPVTERATVER